MLRRFLTMARGRKSPPSSYSSVPPAKKNASRSSTFSAAAAAAAATAATATAAAVAGISSQRSKGVEDGKDKVSGRTPEGGVIVKRRAGDEWDGDGAVGPQVVKAFINYFAREVRPFVCRWCADLCPLNNLVMNILKDAAMSFVEAGSLILTKGIDVRTCDKPNRPLIRPRIYIL